MVSTARGSASTFRGSDKCGGANGARSFSPAKRLMVALVLAACSPPIPVANPCT
jgi:catalase (peroxidase I)